MLTNDEIACIGCCLVDPTAYSRTREIIQDYNDFADAGCRAVYRAMTELYNNGKRIDTKTVAEHLTRNGSLDDRGALSVHLYLDSLVQRVPDVTDYAQSVADYATDKRLREAGDQIVRLAFGLGDKEG